MTGYKRKVKDKTGKKMRAGQETRKERRGEEIRGEDKRREGHRTGQASTGQGRTGKGIG